VIKLTESAHSAILRQVQEFLWIAEALEDPELEEALEYIVKMIKDPNVPTQKVAPTIVHLSALAAKFSFAATYYKTYGNTGTGEKGKEGRYKKDMYYTAADAIPKLVDALKYIVRVNEIR
jgi:hypothetical protein